MIVTVSGNETHMENRMIANEPFLRPQLFHLMMILVALPCVACAQPRHINIVLKDGHLIENAELRSVRDSELIVYGERETYHDTTSWTGEQLRTIRNADIQYVVVKGESKVGPALGTGILIGAGAGLLMGAFSGDDEKGFVSFTAGQKALALGAVLGTVGAVIGLIAGATESTSDQTFVPLPDGDLSVLRPFTRYPHTDPIPTSESH